MVIRSRLWAHGGSKPSMLSCSGSSSDKSKNNNLAIRHKKYKQKKSSIHPLHSYSDMTVHQLNSYRGNFFLNSNMSFILVWGTEFRVCGVRNSGKRCKSAPLSGFYTNFACKLQILLRIRIWPSFWHRGTEFRTFRLGYGNPDGFCKSTHWHDGDPSSSIYAQNFT